MGDKSKFELGQLVANRYRLIEQVNENEDYINYICQYDGWNFFVKIYFGGIKVDEELFEKIKSLGSTNICRVIDSGIFKNRFCIIRTYYHNGNVMQIAPVQYEYLLNEFIPIVNNALNEIHKAGIIHGKISPGNIFFSDFGNDIVLGEFGISLCRKCEEVGAFYSESQYIEFLPPEAINGIVTKEADYYAFGITIYCLALGVKPYLNMEKKEILRAVFTEELPIPDNVNPAVANIIRGLTIKSKDKRWGFDEVARALNGEDVKIEDDFDYNTSFFDDEMKEDFSGDLSLDDNNYEAEEKTSDEKPDAEVYKADAAENLNSDYFEAAAPTSPAEAEEKTETAEDDKSESCKENNYLNINKESEDTTQEDFNNTKPSESLEETIIYNFKHTELFPSDEEKIDKAAKYAVKGILSELDNKDISEDNTAKNEIRIQDEDNKENSGAAYNKIFESPVNKPDNEHSDVSVNESDSEPAETADKIGKSNISADKDNAVIINEIYPTESEASKNTPDIIGTDDNNDNNDNSNNSNNADDEQDYCGTQINEDISADINDEYRENTLSDTDKTENVPKEEDKSGNIFPFSNKNIKTEEEKADIDKSAASDYKITFNTPSESNQVNISTQSVNPFRASPASDDKDLALSNAQSHKEISLDEENSLHLNDNGIMFSGQSYLTSKELVKAMVNNWDEACELLYSQKVADYFSEKDPVAAEIASSCTKLDNKNHGLFRFIYEISPELNLCYKGTTFYDLYDASDGILLPSHTELYEEMLKDGILSFYLIKNNKSDKAGKIIYLEDMARNKERNIDLIICILMYTLSDNPVFTFDERSFKNIDEFVDYLDENPTEVDSICARLTGDAAFYGWVEFLGYGKILRKLID